MPYCGSQIDGKGSAPLQVGVMVEEHREEVGRLHEYIQGSY